MSDPSLPEPAEFATWPGVTPKPVLIGPQLEVLCRSLAPGEAERFEAQTAAKHGPHAQNLITVRVRPEHLAAFQAGRPLADGSAVIKEKRFGVAAVEPPESYAVMVKREPGYFPAGATGSTPS